MTRVMRCRAVVLLALGMPVALAGQVRDLSSPMVQAQMAERRGQYADAARLLSGILDERPTDGAALAALERVLLPSGRAAELALRLGQALDIDSLNIGLLGIAVRTFATTGQADSAARYAERWAALEPGTEGPYREWAIAAVEGRDRESAKRALDTGRQRLGRPAALAPELAQVLQLEGNWSGAASEWLRAVDAAPAYRQSAVAALSRTPPAQRDDVRRALRAAGSAEAPRVLGLTLGRWGDFGEAGRVTLGALPTDAEAAIVLLRALIDDTRGHDVPPVLTVRAALLEAVAARQSATAAVRTRMDAARAYADAGDERNARRLLALVADDPAAPMGMASSASATLLGVLIVEGKADDAERVLREILPTLDADERERQVRRVAMAHARKGNFARADSLVAPDSSVAGFDLRGRIRLLQGDLGGATEFLKLAGPYDTEREHAVERVTLLALLQAVGRDTMTALGIALTSLENADTSRAVTQLRDIADALDPAGAAATRLLAGRLALASGDTKSADRLLTAADVAEFPAVAAEARLARARLDLLASRPDRARILLESILVDFPDSAIVPEARRMYDSNRAAIPGGR